MRQVTVTAPEGRGNDVAQIAFGVGISDVAINTVRMLAARQSPTNKDHLEIETATQLAKEFVEQLPTAPFFNCQEYTITVRQPRAIVSNDDLTKLTRPLVEPTCDLFEELWQFSQVTYGFVGRIYIGALLLAYGLIDYRFLFMIAGLLFIPLLPLMLGIGFSLWTRQWRLLAQASFALVVAITLLMAGGSTGTPLRNPPPCYLESNSPLRWFFISLAVGGASGVGPPRDVGRPGKIGLAAPPPGALIPAWVGIFFLFGV